MSFILRIVFGAVCIYVLAVYVLRLPLRLKYPWNIPCNPFDIFFRPQSTFASGVLDYEEKICKRYPKLYLSFYGYEAQVFVTDATLIKKIGMLEQRSVGSYLEDKFMAMQKEDGASVFASNGKLWQDQRNLYNPAFTLGTIKSYKDAILKAIEDHMVKLNQLYEGGQQLEAIKFSRSLALQVLLKVVFGVELSVLNKEDDEKIQELSDITLTQLDGFTGFARLSKIATLFPPFIQNYLLQLLIWSMGGTDKENESVITYSGAKMLNIYQMRKSQQLSLPEFTDSSKEDDVSDEFMKADTAQGSSLQNFKTWQSYRGPGLFMELMSKGLVMGKSIGIKMIKANLGNFLSAGHETVASTITYALYEISKNKEIEKQIIEEADNSRNIDSSQWDMSMFPYAKAVFYEALRTNAPVNNTYRRLIKSMKLDAFMLPKDTLIVIPIRGIHLNERYWPDPYKFVPERFLGDEKYKCKISENLAWIPFGYGPRMCIGFTLAIQESVFALAKIYQTYTFDVPEHLQNQKRSKSVTMTYTDESSLKQNKRKF